MPRQPLWWAAHSLIRPEECQGEREPCTLDWFALSGAGVPPSLCISKLYTRACLIVFFRRVPAGHFTSADDCEHSFLSLSKCVFVRLDGSELCSFACRSCRAAIVKTAAIDRNESSPDYFRKLIVASGTRVLQHILISKWYYSQLTKTCHKGC